MKRDADADGQLPTRTHHSTHYTLSSAPSESRHSFDMDIHIAYHHTLAWTLFLFMLLPHSFYRL